MSPLIEIVSPIFHPCFAARLFPAMPPRRSSMNAFFWSSGIVTSPSTSLK